MNIHSKTIGQIRKDLKEKKYSSVELTKAYLDRIKKVEGKINAFVTVTGDFALENAKFADEQIAKSRQMPLLGVPLCIKDNFSTKGIRTSASSKVLDNYIPPFDATVVEKLKKAGMVLVGKTNMDAWAHGSSTETSDYGPSKNPWNTKYLPGGSSGGSAASVAAGEAPGAIGSETAGSIRQPASWCGVVGLKPTYGRVSRYGVVAMGSSFDCPGTLTKNVSDSALILNIIAGKDKMDATTSVKPVPDYTACLSKDISGITIGVSDEYLETAEKEVSVHIEQAIKTFVSLGARIKKVKLFPPRYAIAVYTILQRAEVSSNLARFDGIRYGYDRAFFGQEAKRRIMLGTYTLSAGYYDHYYNKALKVRTVIMDNFAQAFQEVDCIIGPTSNTPPLHVGATSGQSMFGEMADVLVEPSAIAGIPGINIPAGFTKNRLPVGMQIMGKQFSEETILRVAHAFEQNTDFHKQLPDL